MRTLLKSLPVTDHIRLAVVKTNPYWPFRQANTWPYSLAVQLLRRACRRYPDITAVYLRHSPVGGNWEPGLRPTAPSSPACRCCGRAGRCCGGTEHSADA